MKHIKVPIRRLTTLSLTAVLTTAAVVGSPAHADEHQLTVAFTNSQGIHPRSSPSMAASEVGNVVPDGGTVSVVCETEGEAVSNGVATINIWEKLSDGTYLPNAVFSTGTDGRTPGVPACGDTATAPSTDNKPSNGKNSPSTSPQIPVPPKVKEGLDCAVNNLSSCFHAEDAEKWARSVTAWRFPDSKGLNDMADAFRHCSWIGALTTRVGANDASRVGFMHEDAAPNNPPDELRMDRMNNYIGTQIGKKAVESGTSDQWGYVMQQCEAQARNHQLYGLGGVQGNY